MRLEGFSAGADAGAVHTIYEAAGGAGGMLALAHAWHQRCLADPVASHPFTHPGQNPLHVERLAAYWGEALGGPPVYTGSMASETVVLRMHAGNGEHADLDARVIACFAEALDELGYEGEVRQALYDYFAWSTARMAAHPDTWHTVPAGAALPHWTWSGAAIT